MPRVLNVDRSHYRIGQYVFVGATGLPFGTLLCDGSSLLRAAYPLLFSVIGTKFGSVDSTHFNLPDHRGRMPMGAGQGSGLSLRAIGDLVGAETVGVTISNMPAHTHPSGSSTSSTGYHEHTYLSPDMSDTVFSNYGFIFVPDPFGGPGTFEPAGIATDGGNPFNAAQANAATTFQAAGSHSHTFTSSSGGSGTTVSHNNVSPALVLNIAMAYL